MTKKFYSIVLPWCIKTFKVKDTERFFKSTFIVISIIEMMITYGIIYLLAYIYNQVIFVTIMLIAIRCVTKAHYGPWIKCGTVSFMAICLLVFWKVYFATGYLGYDIVIYLGALACFYNRGSMLDNVILRIYRLFKKKEEH